MADQLTRTEVLEAILSAQAISKVLRSRRPGAKGGPERLYVIHDFTLDNVLVYTKGKLHREAGQEVYYILILSKRSLEG